MKRPLNSAQSSAVTGRFAIFMAFTMFASATTTSFGIRPLSSLHVASSRLPLPPRARWTSSVSPSKPAASRIHCERGFRIVSTAVISAAGSSLRPASPNAPLRSVPACLPASDLSASYNRTGVPAPAKFSDDRSRPDPLAPRLVRDVGGIPGSPGAGPPHHIGLDLVGIILAGRLPDQLIELRRDHPVDRLDESRTQLQRRIRPGAGGWLDIGQCEWALPDAVRDRVRGPTTRLECRPDRVVEGACLQVRVRGHEPLADGRARRRVPLGDGQGRGSRRPRSAAPRTARRRRGCRRSAGAMPPRPSRRRPRARDLAAPGLGGSRTRPPTCGGAAILRDIVRRRRSIGKLSNSRRP